MNFARQMDFVLQNLHFMQGKRVCFARMQDKGFCFAKFAFYARQANLMCMHARQEWTSCLYAVNYNLRKNDFLPKSQFCSLKLPDLGNAVAGLGKGGSALPLPPLPTPLPLG